MATKKKTDRGDFDRFTSDGYGLSISKPDAAKKKVVNAYNRKQKQNSTKKKGK